MKAEKRVFKDIDDYISTFPQNVQEILQSIRETVHKAAPDAIEAIKYDMPTFVLNGNLVLFSAFKNHIGFYPVDESMNHLDKDLSKYISGRGTAQFQYDQPIPYDLITKIVKYRVEENAKNSSQYNSNK